MRKKGSFSKAWLDLLQYQTEYEEQTCLIFMSLNSAGSLDRPACEKKH